MAATIPMLLVVGAASLALTHMTPLAAAQNDAIAIDDAGFVGTRARCEESSVAVAIGRTQHSLIAICAAGGRYEYRGVRLRDDALLSAHAAGTGDGEFAAAKDGVTYTFSAKELAIATGDRVLRIEPMVAYVEPAGG